MEIITSKTKEEMVKAAAGKAAEKLKEAISTKGHARFIAATGMSQFEFLENLVKDTSIDWSKTTMFHLDEYIGLPQTHPASFRKYLKERLINFVHPGTVHLIQGDSEDPEAECDRVGRFIADEEIDAAFVGIGENGHLAFNDPPADFQTEKPYIIVQLDEACRRQQLGEGWFNSFDEVPQRAVSMSIKQIMKSKSIVCIVPDTRKAQAVRDCFEGEISPDHPASILREHDDTFVYLDKESASLLKNR